MNSKVSPKKVLLTIIALSMLANIETKTKQIFKKEKKELTELMGSIFDYSKRAPAVPSPQQGAQQEYTASVKAWSSQSKRVKNCASNIELLYKDVTRLNLLLRFLKSPQHDIALKMRLFTCVDVDSKLSKLLWKFNNNTVIR